MGDKSAENSQLCLAWLFAYICVYVDVFFEARLFFICVFSPETLFKNNEESVL